MFSGIFAGTKAFFTVGNVLISLLGVVLGIIVGAIPGLGPSMAVAVLVPITYAMHPSAGMLLLMGVFCGAVYGGSRKTLDIILNDRITATEIMLNGGNIQEFYRGSETAKTDFYNKNSCAYCLLLEILTENKKSFTVEIIVDGIGGIFTEKVKADNEQQAGIYGLKKFYDEFPAYKGNGKIYNTEVN